MDVIIKSLATKHLLVTAGVDHEIISNLTSKVRWLEIEAAEADRFRAYMIADVFGTDNINKTANSVVEQQETTSLPPPTQAPLTGGSSLDGYGRPQSPVDYPRRYSAD